ncbi:MAG: hypothetical protein J5601_01060, partial [Elusimicrobiaceae bacterium]|nr:hypothetical protein [Elusimicrobiaceae bacterium]
ERKFRALYKDIANIKVPPLVIQKPYEMSIRQYTSDKEPRLGFWKAIFSATILIFYVPLLLSLAILFAIVIKK